MVEKTPLHFTPRTVCAVDVAYRGDQGFATGILWDLSSSEIVVKSNIVDKVRVDYLPGFLAFREGPLILAAASKLAKSAHVFMVDGHGRVHPRRLGLACHVGLALGKPTIGVAKSRFYGKVEGDKIVGPQGSLLGRLVETASGKLFYVSVGNQIGLDDAIRLVGQCVVGDHIAPLREAHLEAVRLRRAG